MALVFTACELNLGFGDSYNAALTDITIECIAEEEITNNTGICNFLIN